MGFEVGINEEKSRRKGLGDADGKETWGYEKQDMQRKIEDSK